MARGGGSYDETSGQHTQTRAHAHHLYTILLCLCFVHYYPLLRFPLRGAGQPHLTLFTLQWNEKSAAAFFLLTTSRGMATSVSNMPERETSPGAKAVALDRVWSPCQVA